MPAQNKKKVLLIDDRKEFAGLIRVYLSREFEVRTAYSGAEAIDLLQSKYTPDVIITDLLMPKMDGYQLIRMLKSDSLYTGIPIIVLSSVERHQALTKLSFQGLAGFVGKSFISRDLFRELIPLIKQSTNSVIFS
jgi:CheY-like chemotaxis protein